MVNNVEFGKRLKKVMEYYSLTSASLADSIGVQRSSISHLLSGRNKPSLDFVMKVLDKYKEVELYWLLNGKGTFPKQEVPTIESTTPTPPKMAIPSPNTSNMKQIERIVVFYNDGTFDSYSK